MTYPESGNYGITEADGQRGRPWVRGFVVRELSGRVSNHRAQGSLEGYLEKHGIIGLEGIDTRALVRRTREQGAMKGILSTTDGDDASLVEKARQSPGLVGRDLAREVMPRETFAWEPGLDREYHVHRLIAGKTHGERQPAIGTKLRRPHVVALDFGMKWNILRHLVDIGCRVTAVPGSKPAQAILDHEPDGIFLSNGPGDPSALVEAVETLRTLIRKAAGSQGVPIFGICLGHQLLGQALGGKTFKLKFGHRGANHPVRDERTGKVEITTQNHGFAVDPSTLPGDVELSHVNLNDQTLEGLRHKRLPVFGVQYHPEASAGPHDSQYLFDEFRAMMK
jgi:carbamoyl-phosphate synthase small subunit